MGSLCAHESKVDVEEGQPAAVPHIPSIANHIAKEKAHKAINEDLHETLDPGNLPKAPPVRRSSRQSADIELREADALKNLNALYQMAGPKQ